MEVGERFEFVEFRFHGRDQWLPVHPHHTEPIPKLTQKKIEELIVVDSVRKDAVAGGNVGLLKLLMYRYSVKKWQVNGRHTKVVLAHEKFGDLFWFI